MRTNRQKHCSLWLCHAIGVLNGLTDKSHTVVEFDSDRCFCLLRLPNFRKFSTGAFTLTSVILYIQKFRENFIFANSIKIHISDVKICD